MQRKRRSALRWGAICGGAVAALVLIHEVYADAIMEATIANTILAGSLFLILYLLLFFAAGALAAHETGSIGTGALAGLLAGSIAGGAVLIVGLYVNIIHSPMPSPPAHSTLTLFQYHLGITLRVALIFFVLALALAACGAGFGALGGVAGRPTTQPAPATAQWSPPAMGLSAEASAEELAPVAASPLDAPTIASALSADGSAAPLADTMAAEDARVERD